MVIYLAKTHQVVTIDGREMCPAACTSQLFIDPATGKPLPFEDARHSGLSVGVPGMVATWDKAVRNYGTRSFAADLGPAIGVAQRGFTITRLRPAGAGGASPTCRPSPAAASSS